MLEVGTPPPSPAHSWDCRVHVLTAEQVRSKTKSQIATWAAPKVVLFFFLFVLQSIGVNILRQIKYALSSRQAWVRNHPSLEGPMKWLIESNWWDAVRSALLYSSPLLSTVKWRKRDCRLIEMWKDRWSLVWKKGIRKRENEEVKESKVRERRKGGQKEVGKERDPRNSRLFWEKSHLNAYSNIIRGSDNVLCYHASPFLEALFFIVLHDLKIW